MVFVTGAGELVENDIDKLPDWKKIRWVEWARKHGGLRGTYLQLPLECSLNYIINFDAGLLYNLCKIELASGHNLGESLQTLLVPFLSQV